MDKSFLLALIPMVGYGVTAVLYKLAEKHIDPVSLALLTSVIMTLGIFWYWIFSNEKHITTKGFEFSLAAGIIGAVSFITYIMSIKAGKVSIATTLNGLHFVIAAILAVIFLAEKITALKIIGMVLAAGSIILIAL